MPIAASCHAILAGQCCSTLTYLLRLERCQWYDRIEREPPPCGAGHGSFEFFANMALPTVDPAAHATLCRHFNDICRSNVHPGDLAKHLLAKGIIAERTVAEAAKCDTAPKSLRLLLQAIMQCERKDAFSQLLDFIQSDISTRWLAARIRDTYMQMESHLLMDGTSPLEGIKLICCIK